MINLATLPDTITLVISQVEILRIDFHTGISMFISTQGILEGDSYRLETTPAMYERYKDHFSPAVQNQARAQLGLELIMDDDGEKTISFSFSDDPPSPRHIPS